MMRLVKVDLEVLGVGFRFFLVNIAFSIQYICKER